MTGIMATIGKINTLEIIKELSFGVYLDGGEHGEILLPVRYVPKNCKIGDKIDVFIYFDSDDRIIATTEKPYAMVDDFALLKAVSVNAVGAFLDWGLPKDLLVPFREQKQTMQEGNWYIVKIYIDKTSNRIAASAKIDSFLDNLPPNYNEGQEVDLIICNETELGFKAIVNGMHWGMLYKSEVFQPLTKGQKIKGFIKRIRDDEKIDLSMAKTGYGKVDDISEKILEYLRINNSFMAITDKSSPEKIYELFGISKKAYKMAIGNLYKKGLIILEDSGVRLIS
jgi:uncharacterized protein